MSPTKIYVNLDIPEVKQYLDRFGSFNIQPQLLTRKFELVEETSETMPSIRKTISNLIQTSVLEVEPSQRFQVEAEVVGFDIDSGWFYTACKQCTRKLPPAYTAQGCRVCNTPQSESMIWYHLKTIVQDETSSATFIIFGTKSEKLLGTSVNNLIASAAVDPEVFHPVMERLCEKRVKKIFHVTVKHNEYKEDAVSFIVQNLFDLPSTSFPFVDPIAVGRQPICWEGQSKLAEPLKKDEITPLLKKLQSDYLEQIPPSTGLLLTVPPIVLGVDQVKSVVSKMIMQRRKGLQLDDLHENNNKEFSNQSSELYNASITNDYQEKMKRENEKQESSVDLFGSINEDNLTSTKELVTLTGSNCEKQIGIEEKRIKKNDAKNVQRDDINQY
ncbi:hypothetical protein SLEP1_g6461 [Rubroshorea leprosula]|uniref:Replication factor A C-terminal domain-containing protein n=1 Tax=Rubroshorea leprosula TaxID=152421 RepID=A0AAV5HVA5_9ROSI|nr:hypothetical protein SLEP1_g6461 [Rubroshorea leprosula]